METETITAIERSCKDCGTLLGPGRDDRQYCDSACKTNYNNRKRRETQLAMQIMESHEKQEAEVLSVPAYITRIQEIQLNNRKILEGLCSEEKAGSIKMRDLIGKGFNTKFITSETDPTESGRIYRFCFEYGYYEEKGYAIVICRKREVI